jgi:O-antigen/teichoic acid export membrane protein
VVTVPILVHYLGATRFGLLSLIWVLIGSFSIIDLGLGRTLTQFIASALGRGDVDAIAPLVWSSLVLMFVFGALAGSVVALLGPWLVHGGLRIPVSLQAESLESIYLLAFAFPVVLVTAGLRGVLEAQQRFGLSNLVRIPLGMVTFAGPLLVLPFTLRLSAVIIVLVVGRCIAAVAYLVLCLRTTPGLTRRAGPRLSQMLPLLRMGAWISISNLITPVLLYTDRFVIGAVISVGVVAFYTVPFDVTARILVIPSAIAAVLFPAIATAFVSDPGRANALVVRSTKYLFLLLLPITVVSVTFASDGLRIWLGPGFSRQSTEVLQLLALGVFCNGLANVPFTFVQGVGRADITARLHLVELPLYLIALVLLIAKAGIDGAAIAFAMRSFADMTILFILSFLMLHSRRGLVLRMGLGLAVSLAIFAAGTVPPSLITRALFLLVLLPGFAILSWIYVLSPEERRVAIRPFANALAARET